MLRRGDPVDEALRLAAECGAAAMHMSDDCSAYARRRRRRLAAECERAGVRLRTHAGVTVIEPGELVPGGGDHYRVFSPYWRVWSEQPHRTAHPAPRELRLPPGIRLGRIPALRRLTVEAPSPDLPEGVRRPHDGDSTAGCAAVWPSTKPDATSLPTLPAPPASAPISTSAAYRPRRYWPGARGVPAGMRSPVSSAGVTSTTRCWRRGPTCRGSTTEAGVTAGGAACGWPRPGGRAAPVFRLSTPGCASWRARVSCTTARG